jgi:hypothetical protein
MRVAAVLPPEVHDVIIQAGCDILAQALHLRCQHVGHMWAAAAFALCMSYYAELAGPRVEQVGSYW